MGELGFVTQKQERNRGGVVVVWWWWCACGVVVCVWCGGSIRELGFVTQMNVVV